MASPTDEEDNISMIVNSEQLQIEKRFIPKNRDNTQRRFR